MDIEKLRERLRALHEQGQEIFNLAKTEDRGLTDEETAKTKAISDEFDNVQADIEARVRVANQAAYLTSAVERRTTTEGCGPRPDVRGAGDPTGGFAHLGEFAAAVRRQCSPDGSRDPRLSIQAGVATTYGSEGSGADGGFAVPTEFATEIRKHVFGGQSLLALTDNTPVAGNGMTFPSDETTPWGSTGILAYWASEAATVTQTKPLLGERTLKLNKLMSLVPVTDELLEDTSALESYLTTKMGDAIRWKADDAIVNGLGVGAPLGFFKSGALASVAKEGSQTADTINATNVAKMFGSMPANSISTAVWLINNDAYNQLIVMTVGDAPIWTPPTTGMVNAPAGLLLGRPVIMSQSCQTLGDQGDIFFVDLKSYLTITKAGGIKTAMSVHLFFDYDQTAFKATFRMDGQPWLSSAITPANSSVSLSPFVTLDARA